MIDWSSISLRDLAGYLSEELKKRGLDAILVGGACVTIYSENRYQSYDLDYVIYEDMKKVRHALLELGFSEKNGSFQHPPCPWFVEFVAPPVAVGRETVQKFNSITTPYGSIKLLHPVDSVKDRLSSYFYWHDKQSLVQACKICLEQEIDLQELEKWTTHENQQEKFGSFLELLQAMKNSK